MSWPQFPVTSGQGTLIGKVALGRVAALEAGSCEIRIHLSLNSVDVQWRPHQLPNYVPTFLLQLNHITCLIYYSKVMLVFTQAYVSCPHPIQVLRSTEYVGWCRAMGDIKWTYQNKLSIKKCLCIEFVWKILGCSWDIVAAFNWAYSPTYSLSNWPYRSYPSYILGYLQAHS